MASADRSFRQRIAETLTGLRWQVREVEGGAQAWAEADAAAPEAFIVDAWLPDLEMGEFLKEFTADSAVDVVTASGVPEIDTARGPYRQELLYALRRSQDNDTAVWNAAPMLAEPNTRPARTTPAQAQPETYSVQTSAANGSTGGSIAVPGKTVSIRPLAPTSNPSISSTERLPELVGNASMHARGQPPCAAGCSAHDAGFDRRADRIRQGTGG